MHRRNLFGAGPRGLAAATAIVAGLVSVAPALAGPAAAGEMAGSATITSRTLTITGTNGADAVALDADATQALVTFADDAANVLRFNLVDFDSISVVLGNGDDEFTERAGVMADKPAAVAGGNGSDTITTGDGTDTITGGNEDDRVDAGRGTDQVYLENGKDFFVWNPGQGSDAVDGGNGSEDVLQFIGVDGNETMSLSANGNQSVFLRDPGPIRMDMNGIETFDLRTRGGIDNVTVNDLNSTAIRHANIDLSAASGGADLVADVVTVNGTNQGDRIDVTARDGRANVAGLRAVTQIAGSETADHLQVNALDGNDTVTIDPSVSALIAVAVDLGLGQL